MKQSMIKNLWGGVIALCLSMCLTSCEGALDDVLGEWSRPTPGNNTPSSEGGGSSTINATAIALDQKMKVIKLGGDALTINVTFTPSDATDKSVTWESNKETVATVNNGVVTPVGLGIATITAKSGELTATCEVFVGTEVDDVSARNPIQDYDILAGTQNTASITIPASCHVAFNGVTTTNQQIICSGDATIYLIDGKTNTVTAPNNLPGIQVGANGTTLTINAETAGTGILDVTGGNNAAGIGTGNSYYYSGGLQCGNITINGGTINATGKGNAAGIGTGLADNNRNNECGAIKIEGGEVTAKGGLYGAGIGTGYADTSTQTCGAITINGGKVIATGGGYAAGIGTGSSSSIGVSANNSCGAITITTGVTSVTAKKDATDPGPNSIGVGDKDGNATQNCGTIKIGGTTYWESNNYVGTGDPYLKNDITYTPTAP